MSELTRIEQLELVLQYDTKTKGKFTVGERIMINQERAHIFQQMQNDDLDDYEQTTVIEAKIYRCLAEIRETKWKPNPYEYEFK